MTAMIMEPVVKLRLKSLKVVAEEIPFQLL
jgi:hypothetical protein